MMMKKLLNSFLKCMCCISAAVGLILLSRWYAQENLLSAWQHEHDSLFQSSLPCFGYDKRVYADAIYYFPSVKNMGFEDDRYQLCVTMAAVERVKVLKRVEREWKYLKMVLVLSACVFLVTFGYLYCNGDS